MKGVILGIQPRAQVVDLTHEIPPGDIRAGAFALRASCYYFPKGTVHVAVVDPGVGSRRQAIAAQTANFFFVGLDNGALSWALASMLIGGAGGGDGDADDGAVTFAAGDCQLSATLLVANVHAGMWMAVGMQLDFGQRALVVRAAGDLAAAGDAFFQVFAIEGEFHLRCGSRLTGGGIHDPGDFDSFRGEGELGEFANGERQEVLG